MADAILAQSGIYQILNTVNGRVYVGQSANIKRRRAHHFYLLRRGTHSCTYLQRSFIKYGIDAFEFSVLEICTEVDLTIREQFWMDVLKPIGLYNLAPAAGSNKGVKYSPEARAKISAAAKGRKARLGHRNTPETNAAVAAARLGTKMSDATKAKISAVHLGRKLSPEHLAKMSASLKGIPRTDEWRKRQSEAAKGRLLSQETKEKIRNASLGRKQSPELIAKRVALASAAKAAKKLLRESV